ncbi:MAG: hypothetical protein ACK4TR_08815 [Phenylobacterium sp.]|uniref:hypothetical protein n=1 Tax=Phenylobacterium sp. TaxID=1871053 RepID=UPI00391CBFEC
MATLQTKIVAHRREAAALCQRFADEHGHDTEAGRDQLARARHWTAAAEAAEAGDLSPRPYEG